MASKTKSVKDNAIVKSTISRAEAIQQREQLRQMVLSKFIQDYAKKNKKHEATITDLVNAFFKTERVTEESLKKLKSQIISAVQGGGGGGGSTLSQKENSVIGSTKGEAAVARGGDERPMSEKSNQSDRLPKIGSTSSQNQVGSTASNHQQQNNLNHNKGATKPIAYRDEDEESVTSSKKAPSVYQLEGDEDDEWATLVKFDTELFKKEQELEKQRDSEFQRQIKNELDRQLQEKDRKKRQEQEELDAYMKLQSHQMNVYDQREKEKFDDYQNKIMNEKQQRDKQVRDEERRKKLDRKREKELDELLVQRIKEEQEKEERNQQLKKDKERERFYQMMKENEDNKRRADLEAKIEKETDIKMQKEYTRLLMEMEQQREQEKKDREDKIQRIMSSFADSVVKDQKEVIRQEDEKMMKHIMSNIDRENEEEKRKQDLIKQQKIEMREFLTKQVADKDVRKREELEINKKQAEIWSQDQDNYNEHEKRQNEYIQSVNMKQVEILKQQMSEKTQKQKKMDPNELLLNKGKLKNIADKDPEIASKLKKVA